MVRVDPDCGCRRSKNGLVARSQLLRRLIGDVDAVSVLEEGVLQFKEGNGGVDTRVLAVGAYADRLRPLIITTSSRAGPTCWRIWATSAFRWRSKVRPGETGGDDHVDAGPNCPASGDSKVNRGIKGYEFDRRPRILHDLHRFDEIGVPLHEAPNVLLRARLAVIDCAPCLWKGQRDALSGNDVPPKLTRCSSVRRDCREHGEQYEATHFPTQRHIRPINTSPDPRGSRAKSQRADPAAVSRLR